MDDPGPARPILRRASLDPAVAALHARLGSLGYVVDDAGYGPRTEDAVREFQAKRGLRADGICGPQTWGALDECGYRLGDRLLAQRTPMLRGDDVAELQGHLNALGFDAGRPDGIFGPRSERALREFQDNAGVATDGVCGPDTLAALNRVSALAAGSVAELRERETLERSPRRLSDRRVVLSGDPHHRPVITLLAHRLIGWGAEVLVAPDADSAAARTANDFSADLFVALREPDVAGHLVSYFGTENFRSVGGHSHATYMARALEEALGPGAIGTKTYTVLRETRMAAIVVHMPGPEVTRLGASRCAAVLAGGIRDGFVGDVLAR